MSYTPSKPVFVVGTPNSLERARGDLLVGSPGAFFTTAYLGPMDFVRSDVQVLDIATYLAQRPAETPIALGKEAQDALPGALALPHPAAVMQADRAGKAQLHRKVLAIKDALTPVQDVRIVKAQDELQIVSGVVLDPYIVDADTDWIPPAEIERTAYAYLERSRVVGFRHVLKTASTVVESFVMPYPSTEDRQLAMLNEPHSVYVYPYGSDRVHSGAWILGVRLTDKLWEMFKAGELNAFSIGGTGTREKIDRTEMPRVKFVSLLPQRS